MGLICNGDRRGFSPFRHGRGALITYLNGGHPYRNGYLPGRLHNWNVHAEAQTALPQGNLHPHGWLLPRTAGGMSMRALGEGDFAAALIPSRPMSIDLTGSSTFDATAALVVSMAAAFAGSGGLTATLVGRLNATCAMTGSGNLAADMTALASMVVDMLGAGDLDATIAAFGDMSIDIVVTGTGLTTANVGQAVWAALAVANNDAGTMGEKLNDAGSASNPWTEVIESGFTAAEILRLIAAAVGGKSSGHETNAPKYRDLADTKDRIDATTDADGNRLTVDRDLT